MIQVLDGEGVCTFDEALYALAHGDIPPAIWAPTRMLVAMSAFRNAEIAKALAVDPSVVTRWKLANRPIPGNRLEALLAFLRMPLTYELPPPPPPPARAELQLPGPITLLARGVVRSASPSLVPLLWCNSAHGSGGPRRRHHHGPAPSWAPGIARAEDLA